MDTLKENMTPHKRRALYDAERRKSQSTRLASTTPTSNTTVSRLPSPIKSTKNIHLFSTKRNGQNVRASSSGSHTVNSNGSPKPSAEPDPVSHKGVKKSGNEVDHDAEDLLLNNVANTTIAISSPIEDNLSSVAERGYIEDGFLVNENRVSQSIRKNSILVSDSDENTISSPVVSVRRSNTTGSVRVPPANHQQQQQRTAANRIEIVSPVGDRNRKNLPSYSLPTTSSLQSRLIVDSGDKNRSSSPMASSLAVTEIDRVKAQYITEVHSLQAMVTGQDTQIAGLKRCLQECETKLAVQDRVFYDNKIALVMEELHARYSEKHTRKITDIKQNLTSEWERKYTILENNLQITNAELQDLKKKYASIQSELEKERKEKSDMVKLWDEYQQLKTTGDHCEDK
ncbi:hypothetical protein NADFUDRAFT_50442 [Nadsonia fulvescens var. elongata DSM 6958]|uniref:Uncharacterized protein n=1 Tax=Nadsonia fulvescens var. elongata DSM 6958 TaxID=857566 RepID=A0A1E3PM68_9ASCO|nr:hypothetical protein NADFUDRAFT_50442 [Nadsonia fulvescens var. elongata DSM 6958]